MAAEYTDTDAFRGASFREVDLRNATFRECDLRDVAIVGSVIDGLRVSAFGGSLGTVLVEDVDVTQFVSDELDRRHPERVAVRTARSAADHLAAWDLVDGLWSASIERAERQPEATLHQRVDDEWSYVETLRHLIFAVDVWIGRMVEDETNPFHRWALPPTDYPVASAADIGIEVDARPTRDEVVVVLAGRRARARSAFAAVTDDTLRDVRTAPPAPAWDQESHTVAACLRVVLNEFSAHLRYAERDLGTLIAGAGRS